MARHATARMTLDCDGGARGVMAGTIHKDVFSPLSSLIRLYTIDIATAAEDISYLSFVQSVSREASVQNSLSCARWFV